MTLEAPQSPCNQCPQEKRHEQHCRHEPRELQPVLVANGDDDLMVPTSNSVDLARRLPNARLTLYDDAGHGGIFQYHEEFVAEALEFLA
jgi:pimeloyl-ACP methyl ester carboxylesterase